MEEKAKQIDKKQIALISALAVLLCVFILLALYFGGRVPLRYRDFFGYFSAAVTRVSDYSMGSEKKFNEAADLAEDMLEKYHKLFDIYNSYDGIVNIKTLNDNAGGGAVKISSELFEFLSFSKEMHAVTGGEVNIAMGAVLKIWHDHREEGTSIPSMSELEEANKHTDINKLVLNEENMTAELVDEKMSLDVGALAKGYSVEKIAEAFKEKGLSSCVIDSGGNLRIIGTKPDGSSWKTGVKNPFGGQSIYTLELSDTAAVTSGNYENFYIVDGVSYHHIIDKDTLMPAEHFASVTIIHKNSGVADALSTALFNMTYEEGLAVAEGQEARVVWVTLDGQVITN